MRLFSSAVSLACAAAAVALLGAGAACGAGSNTTTTKAPATAEPAYVTALRPQVQQMMKDMEVPGAVVAVRSPDQGDWTEAFGVRAKGGAPITVADHVRIGSNTKTMTATVILQLLQDELIGSLGDKVSKYLPDVPNGDTITLTNLLEMRSGLYNYSLSATLNQTLDDDPTKAWAPQELLALSAKVPFAPPNVDYNYSNTNTVLLGLIIEKLTGHPVEQELKTRIFDKLGMKETSFPQRSSNAIPEPHARSFMYGTNVATMGGAKVADDQLGAVRAGTLLPLDLTDENPSWAWTAGAVISTAEDMVTYTQALGGGGLLDDALQKARLASMKPTPNGLAYGLGLAQFGPMVGHSGEIAGFNSFAAHDPAKKLTVVVWCNLVANPYDGKATAAEIAKVLIAKLYEAPAPSGTP